MSNKQGYERFWGMPYGSSLPGSIPMGFARFAVSVVNAIFSTLFRLKVDNREAIASLKEQSGFVVVSNHTSFLDVIFLYLGIRPLAWPRFVARNTLFDGKPRLFAWALARLGVLPIKRDTADREAIKRASSALKNGEPVVIMPEGTRRGKSNTKPELHAGAALIARMGKAPILPATVRNAELVKQKGKRLKFPQISVEFGSPVYIQDFDFLPKEKRLDACIWYAMRECFALSKHCLPSEVDMCELFPDAEDFTSIFAEHPICESQ